MERHHVSYIQAIDMLGKISLGLVCGDEIHHSGALQAALLTSINSGKRAFRGGVKVCLPASIPLRVPWPNAVTLNDAVFSLGAEIVTKIDEDVSGLLVFGNIRHPTGIRVVCDGWRAGLLPADFEAVNLNGPDFALGGVFAGALGVSQAFMKAAEINRRELLKPIGFSLWRADLSWLDQSAIGPSLHSLPRKLWLLGLGHLGQAYAWTLGLMSFPLAEPAIVYLQDYDTIESGNWSAGLFCEPTHVGHLKTRLAASWLEQRGFQTRVIERAFDCNFKRMDNEPRVAICGFDNPESRQILEEADFEFVVDAGLGASLDHFDRIVLRTFPEASQKARDIWAEPISELPRLNEALFELPEGECGIVMNEISGKAISSAFVGACASAMVLGEVLKALHGGRRCEFLSIQLRDLELPRNPYISENYLLRIARNGIIGVP